MTDPVPAPWRQGDDRKCRACGHWAHGTEECMAFMRRVSDHSITSCRCTTPEEQQGEPVCARCGYREWVWTLCGHRLHGEATAVCDDHDHHPFEQPAPPSSEEAEARRWLRAEESPDFVVWRVNNKDGLPVAAQTISKELEAAIRRPIEEERDRLRALYDEACAAMDVLALHSAPRARAEAAEAQVAKLREHLKRIRTMAAPAGSDFGDAAIVREVDAALAETVQGGGETDGGHPSD